MNDTRPPSAELKASSPLRRRLRLLFKIALFFGVFLGIVLAVMSQMGGNSDVLKETVEQFLSENTGYTARVKTLNNMSFFPASGVDFEGLELYENPGDEKSAVTAKAARLYVDFWDMSLSNGHVNQLEIIELQAQAGSILKEAIVIEYAGLRERPDGSAAMIAEGRIGAHELRFEGEADRLGTGEHKTHRLAFDRGVSLAIGPLALKGRIIKGASARIEDFSVSLNNKAVLQGTLMFEEGAEGAIHLRGDLADAQGRAVRPDLAIRFESGVFHFTGDIQAQDWTAQDFASGTDLYQLAQWLDLDAALELQGGPAHLRAAGGGVTVEPQGGAAP